MRGRTWLRLCAPLLAAPLALVAPAVHADIASGTLTGTVYLPDGTTPASAAVVDLSADPTGTAATAFARGVSGYDGRFAVSIPPSPELVTLAAASSDQLTVYLTISKLVPTGGVPTFVQHVRKAVANLERKVDEAGEVTTHFVLPQPDLGRITPTLADIALAARVYQDPDLVLGNDDLNDPDLIPPLGSVMESIPMTAAGDPLGAAGESPLTPAGVAVDGILPTPENEGGSGNGCTIITTQVVPARNQPQPVQGITMRVVLQMFHCKNEEDPRDDYYALGWKGNATNNNDADYRYTLWRLKFRTKLPDPYLRVNEDPTADISTGGEKTVTWSVGFDHGATGSISGSYTVVKAKKIHPWSDGPGKLYHVSWISNNDNGSSGAQFWNGGGNSFTVPQGEGDAKVIQRFAGDGYRVSGNTIQIWKCTVTRDTGARRCDPH